MGVGGGGETAEKRVENELRQAIKSKHPASSTNVAASSVSSSQNSCKSFHDSMIEQANAARTGEASDATTSVIINIRDYLKKPYLPWSTDPLSYWLSEKKSGCIQPFIEVVNNFFCIPATSVSSEMLFSSAGDLIRDQRSRLSADNVDMLLLLNKNA